MGQHEVAMIGWVPVALTGAVLRHQRAVFRRFGLVRRIAVKVDDLAQISPRYGSCVGSSGP